MSPSFFVVGIVVAPTATTTPASVVLATSATLNGVVSDGLQSQQGGGTSTWLFQWGTDPNFGSFSSTTSTSFSGMAVSVSANVSGLTASTRYYARVVATNTIGTTTGKAVSFETSTNLPTLVAPSDGTTEIQMDQTFSWIYNSGGAAGGQTGYSLRVVGTVPTHGNGTWYWNGSAWTATQTWITSSAQSVTIPQAFLSPNTSYTWTVATQDANGNGPYA